MIQSVQQTPTGNLIYYGFHGLGFLCVFLFNVWYGKKHAIKPVQSILTTIIVYSVSYLWLYVQFWIETGFQRFGGNNIVRGFVYVPLFAWPVARWLKISGGKMYDFIAPCICLCHGVSHIGCIFVGCCHGYPCSWGIYNWRYITPAFPIQLFEAATALAIFGYLVWLSRRKNFDHQGKAYPIMLILFGSTRFLWEFGRANQKILLGCSSLAFHALFMAAVGTIALWYLNSRKPVRRKRS